MRLWSANAGWSTVYAYLGVVSRRMRAQAKINQRLLPAQREALIREAEALGGVRAALLAGGRVLEDFQDGALAEARAEAFVWDWLCDESNYDAWKTLGMSEGRTALAAAGKKREDLFETSRITEVLDLGRAATVATASSASTPS